MQVKFAIVIFVITQLIVRIISLHHCNHIFRIHKINCIEKLRKTM
jgi:hypothetical protein